MPFSVFLSTLSMLFPSLCHEFEPWLRIPSSSIPRSSGIARLTRVRAANGFGRSAPHPWDLIKAAAGRCCATLRHWRRGARIDLANDVDNVHHSVPSFHLRLVLETPWMVVSVIISYVDLSLSSIGGKTIGIPWQVFRSLVRAQALSLKVLRFRWDGAFFSFSIFN